MGSNATTQQTRSLLALLAFLVGCQQSVTQSSAPTGQLVGRLDPATDINVGELTRRSIPLGRVVAIHTAELGNLLAGRDYGALKRSELPEVLSYAAKANSRDALGIIGELSTGIVVSPDDHVIAMDNPTVSPDGVYQATKYHFTALRISGQVSFAFVNVSLHFNSDEEPPLNPAEWRGCRPAPENQYPLLWAHDSEGGAGLPFGTLFDAETDARPQSVAGQTIELRIYTGVDLEQPRPNRLACAGNVEEQGVSPENGEPLQGIGDLADIENSAVVAEHDFQMWLNNELIKFPKTPEFGKEVAITSAKLNDTHALGIVSTPADGSPTVNQLFVLRNPFVDFDHGRFEGNIVIVIPGPVKLPPGIFGANPKIAFNIPIPGPSGPWESGVCGLVSTPGPTFRQDLLGGYAYSHTQAMYGTHKYALGSPRSTIAFPVMFNGRLEFDKLACSAFQPPTPQQPPECLNGINPITGAFIPEDCNGVDDNCNGAIDELGVCDVPACNTCVPTTCTTNRCMSLPDGCGAVLTCPCS